MHTRPFSSMPIIDEIIKEDMPYILGVGRSNNVARVDEGYRPRKKRKISKKSAKKDIDTAVAANIKDELNF